MVSKMFESFGQELMLYLEVKRMSWHCVVICAKSLFVNSRKRTGGYSFHLEQLRTCALRKCV